MDEVVSGFGRTGKMFGHEHWGVKADVFSFAKGMASGYMPVAATVVKEHIFEAFYGETTELMHFRHINTYGGHPVAAAVSLKNIDIVKQENLPANAVKMEKYIKNRLSELKAFTFYTLEKQYGIWLDHAIYTDKNAWFLFGRARYQSFPLMYHGIGSKSTLEPIARIDGNFTYFKEWILREVFSDFYTGIEFDIQIMNGVSYKNTVNSFILITQY